MSNLQPNRVVVFSCLALLFSSCAGPGNILYEFSQPLNVHEDSPFPPEGSHSQKPLNPNGIDITWRPTARYIGFTLENNSSDTVRIHWDRCVYLDTADRAFWGVVHGFDVFAGLPPIPPSTRVLPDSSYEGTMFPQGRVYHAEIRGTDTWIPISLLPSNDSGDDELQEAKSFVGKRIGVVLALERLGKVEGWHYEFEISSVEPELK